MPKADVLNLVAILSNFQADPVLTDQLYDNAVDDLSTEFWISKATLITITPATTEIKLPDTLRTLAAVLWDDLHLGYLTNRQLKSLQHNWRARRGSPNSWTDEGESAKTIALYPTPFTKSDPYTGHGGTPLGATYPTYSMVIFHSEYRQDVPAYLELHLAFSILQREFSRESDHKDLEMAKWAGLLKDLTLEMVR